MQLNNAFSNLIETKPFPVIFDIMRSSHGISEPNQRLIYDAVLSKHPRLHPFDYLIFELPHINANVDFATFIYQARSETEKLVQIGMLLSSNELIEDKVLAHFGFRRFLQIPSDFPLFFQQLSNGSKFMLAKIAILHENIDILIRMIELDGRVALLTDFLKVKTLFDVIIHYRKFKFIPLFLSLVPELAFEPKSHGIPSIYESLIIAGDIGMIKAFEIAGFSSEAKLILGKNAIQLAYEIGDINLLQYFNMKYGNERITFHLNSM